jgi:zinc protease
MPLLRLFLALALLPLLTFAAAPNPPKSSDLRTDPAARSGVLPNGLRYVIYPNHEPKNRASFRLLVQAGSLHEAEDQRGLAHFLEHLAFNGSVHYAPGTLVEFFQRMGMSFGGDTNANTGFDRTVYLLELPDVKPATLHEGLRVFSDYAGGLLLEPKSIEKERGIILSEKRTHDSVGFRSFVAQYEFLLGGSLFPRRIPIGEANVIETAQRDRFLEFYNTWYRPELMSVVVVGDIDPAEIEKEIVATFSSATDRAPAKPIPDRGKLAENGQVRVLYHYEPEAPGTTVSLAAVDSFPGEPDTAENRLKELPRTIATAMVNRRLSVLAKQEHAPFLGGELEVEDAFDFYREASLSLSCKAEQWSAALSIADQELRRALEHGFQTTELQEATANYLNYLEQEVQTASTRKSADIADQITESLEKKEVFTSPVDDLTLFKPALQRLSVADCTAALRAAWGSPGRAIIVSGNAVIGRAAAVPSSVGAPPPVSHPNDTAEAAILAAYKASQAIAVVAPVAEKQTTWAYTDFGPSGAVAHREHIADLDLDLIQFKNGVRLNLKKTAFQASVINLNARVGSGTITEPTDRPGLAALAGATFDAGGLGRHSLDDLQQILAGKNVGVRLSTTPNSFVLRSVTTPADLLLDLQLLGAKLTDPGYRSEALRQVRKGIEQLYLSFEHTAQGPLARQVARLLASGDSRFGMPDEKVLLSRSLDEVRAWLTPQLTRGAIEIGMVGDLDIEATIAAVGKTLGALPAREPKPALPELRQVHFPQTPFDQTYRIASEIPKGLVVIYWPTTDESDVHRTRRLNILSTILEDRLRVRIREELGGTYSPNAGSFTSDAFPGYGYLTASVDVEPGMATKISDAVVALADDLAVHGTTADELLRAKQPVLTAIRESSRDNGYWLGAVLSRAQEKPEVLDWARSRTADIESITVDQINQYARQYLGQNRRSRVIVLPSAARNEASQPASAPTTANP